MGDLLQVGATGGRVDGGTSLSCLGAYGTGYLPQTGRFIAHSGPANTVFFQAIEAGQARITLFTGDPFHHPGAITAEVNVQRIGCDR